MLDFGVQVLNGCDTTAVYALMAGATGAIWGAANYMPHEAVALYNHVAAGEYAEALVLWQKMLPSLLHIWTHDYMQCVVTAARHRGFGLGNVRRPLRQITDAQKAEMIATLAPLEG